MNSVNNDFYDLGFINVPNGVRIVVEPIIEIFVLPKNENEKAVPAEVERLERIRKVCNLATQNSKTANGISNSESDVRFRQAIATDVNASMLT